MAGAALEAKKMCNKKLGNNGQSGTVFYQRMAIKQDFNLFFLVILAELGRNLPQSICTYPKVPFESLCQAQIHEIQPQFA